MNTELKLLIEQVLKAAEERNLNQKELSQRTGIGTATLSRLNTGATDDTRFSTLQQLGQCVGLKLIWVQDSPLAEHVARGDLFE